MPKRSGANFKFQCEGVQNPDGSVDMHMVPNVPRDAAQGQPASAAWTVPDARQVLEAVQQDDNPLAKDPSRKSGLLSDGLPKAIKQLRVRICNLEDNGHIKPYPVRGPHVEPDLPRGISGMASKSCG